MDYLCLPTFCFRFVASMSDWWTRKVDILNRGFSGYNSRWGLNMFGATVMNERPDLVVLFFGANDSIDEQVLQHVSLDEFRDNLDQMVASLIKVSFLLRSTALFCQSNCLLLCLITLLSLKYRIM